MRHAILGVGGVGGLIAASLAQCGDKVTVVVRSGALDKYPETLRLESAFGNFTVPVERVTMVPPTDLLWIAVKATQLEPALASIPDASSISAIIPLLNGIDHIAMLRSRYGQDRVVPATIAVESERISPGYIVHRSPFARLNVSSVGRTRIQSAIDKLQGLGFTCNFVDDEQTLLWSKLVFLAPLALATTAAGKTTGEIARDEGWKRQLEDGVQEACAVANAEGATVNCDSVLSAIRALPPGTRSSMQKDVEQRNAPELDAIAGPILRGAAQRNLEIPITLRLVTAVEERVMSNKALHSQPKTA